MKTTRTRLRVAGAAIGIIAMAALTACNPAGNVPAEQNTPDASAEASSTEMTDVTLQIEGSAVPYYAPIYEAIEQGYFADEGLNVEVLYAEGATVVQNVAAGNVDFGFPNGPGVVAAYANGVETRVVHTTYQTGIGSILFNEETSGIETVADLRGRTIAVTDLGSPQYLALQLLLQDNGVDISEVEIKVIGVGAIIQALQNGEVDAVSFNSVRYYALKSQGFPVGQFLTDPALPSHGNVLIAGNELLEQQPEVVASFIAALDQGLQYVIENPAESVDMSIEQYAPTFEGQNEAITEVINEVYIAQLWNSEDTEVHGFGYGNLPRWQESIDVLVEGGLIAESFDAADLVIEEPGTIG
ncbi:ABC transporter substrate-binding protein [Agrococcus sp. Marseille-Q4369]|uniref:ABC transporter substrate-binding protein n=1 Tax=Agrococcus sp. Marseille-Q4369 TaxID=2810513 RepID=UPI001B8CDF60|nr:ABC transporter substrate-binding protein [Agrococcus sp. Marseille-Q4369]QUW17830.1 ABC transporter substrate-binding protein [Agrococcus sp. Marseille-Q4369]